MDRLYIGMRQYVGEFDISSKRLRLLVPADSFVNFRRTRSGKFTNNTADNYASPRIQSLQLARTASAA
jgi:hypothetical protein